MPRSNSPSDSLAAIAAAQRGFAITPHDTNPLTRETVGIYVGGAGAITLRLAKDSADVVLTAVPVGVILPIAASHVRATGTTATNLVGLAA